MKQLPRAKSKPITKLMLTEPLYFDLRKRNAEAKFLGSYGGQDGYLINSRMYIAKSSTGDPSTPSTWGWEWVAYALVITDPAKMNASLTILGATLRVKSIDGRKTVPVELMPEGFTVEIVVDTKDGIELIGHPTETLAVRKWKEVEEMIEYGWKAKMYAILSGIPGTGKTTLGDTTAKSVKVGHVPLTLDQDLYPDKLLGHFVPKGNQEWGFMHGPLTDAYVNGKITTLNEINCAAGSVLTALYPVLDDRGVSRLVTPVATHEPHINFYAIATTNVPIRELAVPEALLDRFPLRIEINVPNPKAVQKLANVAIRKLVWEVYSVGNPMFQKITFRQLKAVDALLQHGCAIGMAAHHVMQDSNIAKEIASAIGVGSSTK